VKPLLLAACLLLVAATPALALDRWWLGEDFDGLPLTHDEGGFLIYGDCDPEPDSGCAAPVEVQNRRTCERNPVSVDIPARRVFGVRGSGIAADYGDGIDVLTYRSTVTVFASRTRARRAVDTLRRRRASAPPARLRRPRFPWPVLAEIKRVQIARRDHTSIRAISRATGVSRGRVRVRLKMADLLGRAVLADVAAPGISWRRVQHYRQVAFFAQELGPRFSRRHFDVSRAELRRIARRVRGLTSRC
jgi:hypothetical protein